MTLRAKKLDGCEMKGVQRSDRNGKWLKRTSQHRRREFEECQSLKKFSGVIAVRACSTSRVQPIP